MGIDPFVVCVGGGDALYHRMKRNFKERSKIVADSTKKAYL